jgi:hypothetical protein
MAACGARADYKNSNAERRLFSAKANWPEIPVSVGLLTEMNSQSPV